MHSQLPRSIAHASAADRRIIRLAPPALRTYLVREHGRIVGRDARRILQDVATYEETQETLALLKILALGNKQIEQARLDP